MQSLGNKLIFAGPVGVGKTTAISALSEIPPVCTDVAATDETLARKATTTVAMDYGFMTLEDGSQIHLYGTPGQDRFDFMWEILTRGGLGLVLLVDATSSDPAADLERYLDAFGDFIRSAGAVIGITRSDLANQDVYSAIQQRLRQRDQPLPVFEIDARRPEEVRLLIEALLAVLATGE